MKWIFYSPNENLFIQVSYYLDKINIDREIRALVKANIEKDSSNIKNRLIIITENLKNTITVGDKKITILPLYEWLLKKNQVGRGDTMN